jgi:tetratricopeptide (TPR) repeat protein
MPENINNIDMQRAQPLFLKAEQVAATDNFDYAIDMYLEGLKYEPDSMDPGHVTLRKVALIRQGKGGKSASMMEKMKHRGGKTPVEEMLNAEYLLAHDPDNLTYAEAMLRAAVAGTYTETAKWLASLIFDANKAESRPSVATYMLLKDCYSKLQMFDKAVFVCKHALQMRPEDGLLQNEFRDLSAQMTMQRGKYGEGGDFRDSIKDKDSQDQLHMQQNKVKTIEFRIKAVENAKTALRNDPDSAPNLLKLAESLYELDTEKGYQSALKVLQGGFEIKKDFSFKRRLGELKTKKLRKGVRDAQKKASANPKNALLKNEVADAIMKFDAAQLEHFAACVAFYPTDLRMKYEYGLCLIKHKRYDEAIPFLQEAQRDPGIKIAALDETGLCFFLKGWYADAIDVFTQTLDSCEVQDGDLAKDIRYNLARSYEEDGQLEKAMAIFRKLAQLDFGFKDVRQRIDKLRNGQSI